VDRFLENGVFLNQAAQDLGFLQARNVAKKLPQITKSLRAVWAVARFLENTHCEKISVVQ
jgi:hypothetical protein